MLIRRSFLIGLASSLAAPAIVHAGNLMPIKWIYGHDDIFWHTLMVRGIWWDLSGKFNREFNHYADRGQVSTTDNTLKPLRHFLDIMDLPPDARWGILN